MMAEILKIENLTKKFQKKNFFSSNSKEVVAADAVNFSLKKGSEKLTEDSRI